MISAAAAAHHQQQQGLLTTREEQQQQQEQQRQANQLLLDYQLQQQLQQGFADADELQMQVNFTGKKINLKSGGGGFSIYVYCKCDI